MTTTVTEAMFLWKLHLTRSAGRSSVFDARHSRNKVGRMSLHRVIRTL